MRGVKTCPKCAETVKKAALVCKHCGASFEQAADIPKPKSRRFGIGCLAVAAVIVGVGLIAGRLMPATTSPPDAAPSGESNPVAANTGEKWETFTGIQQGMKVSLDIDANSIKRTSDGASATVNVRLAGDDVENVTYICRAPSSGVPGAVISNGQVVDLPSGSASNAVMLKVCFGTK